MPGQDGTRPVELLGKDEAGQLVGQGHGAERQHCEPGACCGAPTVGGPYGENEELRTCFFVDPDEPGQGFGGLRLAARVEQDNCRGGAPAFFFESGEKRVFGAVSSGFGGQIEMGTGEVLIDQGLHGPGVRARGDGGEQELHGKGSL